MEDNKTTIDSTYNPIRLTSLMKAPEAWDDLPIEKIGIGEVITMKWARRWVIGVFNRLGMDYAVEESTDEGGASKVVKFRVTNFLPDTDTRYGIAIQSTDGDSSMLEIVGVYHRFGSSMIRSTFDDFDEEISAEDKKFLETVYDGSYTFSIPDWAVKFAKSEGESNDIHRELCLWLKTIMAFKTFLQIVYADLKTIALRDCQDQLLHATKSIGFDPYDLDSLEDVLNEHSGCIVKSAKDITAALDNAIATKKEAMTKEESNEDNSENASEQA